MRMLKHLPVPHPAATCLCAAGILFAAGLAAHAVRPDECEQQRKHYPADWTAVAKDKTLFKCQSHYAGAMWVKLGEPDTRGRAIVSLVPVRPASAKPEKNDPASQIYRMWLDAGQVRRLKRGDYFATVVRSEESCWIRGDLSGDPVFVMDNANPPADGPGASAFYNKAPRLSAFQGQHYVCKPAK